jgi:hypothetical protein
MKAILSILVMLISAQVSAQLFNRVQIFTALDRVQLDDSQSCKGVKYQRKSWRHWVDSDKDCQNTRHEILISESRVKPQFVSQKKCKVQQGHWYDPFSGVSVQNSRNVQIDHLVALRNAHDSGGCRWSAARKQAFANDMNFKLHLNAMYGRTNQAKSAFGPDQWRPPKRSSWCLYAKAWTQIKYNWRLTMTTPEKKALAEMLRYCQR